LTDHQLRVYLSSRYLIRRPTYRDSSEAPAKAADSGARRHLPTSEVTTRRGAMHTLEHAMKSIVAGQLHLAIIERQDGFTGIAWTRHPQQYLSILAGAAPLGRIEVRPSPHAVVVLDGLRKRFANSVTDRSDAIVWTTVEFEQCVAALDEYDLERGALVSRDGIRPNDRVYVTNLGKGVVTGFTRCGRIMVRLDRPNQLAEVAAFAPRSCVKPILTAARA
jgi:hypothetical protein